MEEGKSRNRESSQEATAIVQVRLDGGLTLVVRVKMDQVDRSKLEPADGLRWSKKAAYYHLMVGKSNVFGKSSKSFIWDMLSLRNL